MQHVQFIPTLPLVLLMDRGMKLLQGVASALEPVWHFELQECEYLFPETQR